MVLKHIGSSVYHHVFPYGVEIHPGFHVSRLQELLGFGDHNTFAIEILVTYEDLASKSHVPQNILDVKTKHLYVVFYMRIKMRGSIESVKNKSLLVILGIETTLKGQV